MLDCHHNPVIINIRSNSFSCTVQTCHSYYKHYSYKIADPRYPRQSHKMFLGISLRSLLLFAGLLSHYPSFAMTNVQDWISRCWEWDCHGKLMPARDEERERIIRTTVNRTDSVKTQSSLKLIHEKMSLLANLQEKADQCRYLESQLDSLDDKMSCVAKSR